MRNACIHEVPNLLSKLMNLGIERYLTLISCALKDSHTQQLILTLCFISLSVGMLVLSHISS